mgnify:CR=1 FL=1
MYQDALRSFRAGRVAEAVRLASGIGEGRADYQPAQLLLAEIAARQGRREPQRDHLLNALAAGRIDGPAAAHALKLVGETDDAAGIRRLVAVLPQRTNEVGLLVQAALTALRLGATDEGIGLLRSLAAKVDHPQIHYNLGTALKNAGDLAGAEAALRRAATLAPGLAEAHHNLGNLLLDQGRAGEAATHYAAASHVRRRVGSETRWNADLFEKTTKAKLCHDIEQIAFMRQNGVAFDGMDGLEALYAETLDALPADLGATEPAPLPAATRERMAAVYNRIHYVHPAERMAAPIVNPDIDWARIERDYAANGPGWIVIDDFLTEPALDALWRYCQLSTFWFNFYYRNGYLGTSIEAGFTAPLLIQIGEALRTSMPALLAPHPLRKVWSFKKCDYSTPAAVGLHADFAAVNSNFWITPDSANLEPTGAGLEIWDKEAPLEWDFAAFNAGKEKSRDFRRESGAKRIDVPYRRNRMIVFNSNLFHESGPVTFKPGYENHRINVTMLFGQRGGRP